MASVNRIKQYIDNGTYHIYNRGVNKQRIFFCQEDFRIYIRYIEQYLLPQELLFRQMLESKATTTEIIRVLSLKNYFLSVKILAYCLMPNHIHFIVEQVGARIVSEFMKSLHTRYGMYLNRKYKRVGPVFQDIFKARIVKDDRDLLATANYIHRNPVKLASKIERYKWSSLQYYSGIASPEWIGKEKVLGAFEKSAFQSQYHTYKDLVKDQR